MSPSVIEEAREALRVFLGCSYKVGTSIDPRGYSWSEAWLDEARPIASRALAALNEGAVSDDLLDYLRDTVDNVPPPGGCQFCGHDPYHRTDLGEPVGIVCCEPAVWLRGTSEEDEEIREAVSRLIGSRAEQNTALQTALKHIESPTPSLSGLTEEERAAPLDQLEEALRAMDRKCSTSSTAWPHLQDALKLLPTLRAQLAGEGWRTMESAPRDGQYILAIVGKDDSQHMAHLEGRVFSIRPEPFGTGWSVFPGYGGAPSEWFTYWKPLDLPAPPAPAQPDTTQETDDE